MKQYDEACPVGHVCLSLDGRSVIYNVSSTRSIQAFEVTFSPNNVILPAEPYCSEPGGLCTAKNVLTSVIGDGNQINMKTAFGSYQTEQTCSTGICPLLFIATDSPAITALSSVTLLAPGGEIIPVQISSRLVDTNGDAGANVTNHLYECQCELGYMLADPEDSSNEICIATVSPTSEPTSEPTPVPTPHLAGAAQMYHNLDAGNVAYVSSSSNENTITYTDKQTGLERFMTLDSGVTGKFKNVKQGDSVSCTGPCAVHGDDYRDYTNEYAQGTFFLALPYRAGPQTFTIAALKAQTTVELWLEGDKVQTIYFEIGAHGSQLERRRLLASDEPENNSINAAGHVYSWQVDATQRITKITSDKPIIVHVVSGGDDQNLDSTALFPTSADWIYGTASNVGVLINAEQPVVGRIERQCTDGNPTSYLTTNSSTASSDFSVYREIEKVGDSRTGVSCRYRSLNPDDKLAGMQNSDGHGVGDGAMYLPAAGFGRACPISVPVDQLHFISAVKGTECRLRGTTVTLALTQGSSYGSDTDGIWHGQYVFDSIRSGQAGDVWDCNNDVMLVADTTNGHSEYNVPCFEGLGWLPSAYPTEAPTTTPTLEPTPPPTPPTPSPTAAPTLCPEGVYAGAGEWLQCDGCRSGSFVSKVCSCVSNTEHTVCSDESKCATDEVVAALCDCGTHTTLGADTKCVTMPKIDGPDEYPYDVFEVNRFAELVEVIDVHKTGFTESVRVAWNLEELDDANLCHVQVVERLDVELSYYSYFASEDGSSTVLTLPEAFQGNNEHYQQALRQHLVVDCGNRPPSNMEIPVTATLTATGLAGDSKSHDYSMKIVYHVGPVCPDSQTITMKLHAEDEADIATPFSELHIANVDAVKSMTLSFDGNSGINFDFTQQFMGMTSIDFVSTSTSITLTCKHTNCLLEEFEDMLRPTTAVVMGTCENGDNLDSLAAFNVTLVSDLADAYSCMMDLGVVSPPAAHHGNIEGMDDTCVPCSCGSYQANSGQSTCNSCGGGMFGDPTVSQNSSAHCAVCECGTWSSEAEVCGACSGQCPIGTHGMADGDPSDYTSVIDACSDCACGSYQPFAGQCACVVCPPGTIGLDTQGVTDGLFTDATHCAICDAGTFSFETQSGICSTDLPEDAATACSNLCPAGTYGDDQTAPHDQSARSFVGTSTIPAPHCTACPTGWSQPLEGQTMCHECTSGKYFSPRGADKCSECEFEAHYSSCSASCSTCDGNIPITTPTKTQHFEVLTHGYDVQHTNAALEQCIPASPTDVACNTECCPRLHQCHKSFSCGFVQHSSGHYTIQVQHAYNEPNEVHKCHLLEDGFGGKECVCECYGDGNEDEDTPNSDTPNEDTPTPTTRRLRGDAFSTAY